MAKKKKKWTEAELLAWAKREFPADFAPEPTVFNGGIDRMIKLWEASRDCNKGGYGSGVTHTVRGWGKPSPKQVTSCSPFTATVIGMMFDDRGGEASDTEYQPKYDNGQRALPNTFYALHNGFYFSKPDPEDEDAPAIGPAREKWFRQNKWPIGSNSSGGSLVFLNLGYEIDPRDMRRGDMVAINWANRGGHATFCWDVHLDASGAVDCFLFLSANGGKRSGGGYFGTGVSVGTASKMTKLFFDKADAGNFQKKGTMFTDKPEYIEHGHWECLPNISKKKIDLKTFNEKAPPLGNIIDSTEPGGHSVDSLRVIRFWGVAPPAEPHGKLLGDKADKARERTRWQPPAPYAVGSAKPSEGRIENVQAKAVPRTEPDPVKAVPPAPAPQKKEQVVGHQLFVEQALAELFTAKWIAKDPGQPDAIADAQSKAAIEDFQAKFKIDGENGQAGPKTRAALKKTLDDLHAGKPNPNKPVRKPVIEQFTWASNQVAPGGTCRLSVHGKHLDLVATYQVALTDASGASQTVAVPIDAKSGQGTAKVAIPAAFGAGSALSTRISGGGATKSSGVLLYVVSPSVSGDAWPWDEAAWPASVRDIVQRLRAAPRPTGRSQPRRITQYGVWHSLAAGDTPVLDRSGSELGRVDRRSLYLADLEGTMRLDGRILNLVVSGNVFDPRMGKATFAMFEPRNSRWVDVSDRAPWGMGARLPLIPFRTLAYNASWESPLYGKQVFIEQLRGVPLPTGEVHNGVCIVGDAGSMEPGKQLDLFVGPEGNRLAIPVVCNVEILG